MNETISNQTMAKCQNCGSWTNFSDSPHYQRRLQEIDDLNTQLARLRTVAEIAYAKSAPLQRLQWQELEQLEQALSDTVSSAAWMAQREIALLDRYDVMSAEEKSCFKTTLRSLANDIAISQFIQRKKED